MLNSSLLSSHLQQQRQLDELVLIKCSLLPGEQLEFLDSDLDGDAWQILVENGVSTTKEDEDEGISRLSPARFSVKVDAVNVWFDIDFQRYDGRTESVNDCIKVSGENLSRIKQESWRKRILEKVEDIIDDGGEYPIYQIISLHLLPLLHEEIEEEEILEEQNSAIVDEEQQLYHVLFTSHHLISPTKRRNLQYWSSLLKVFGFAKVGYPGVIYGQGLQNNVEEFVENVKNMQWLALKLRFVEALDISDIKENQDQDLKGWKEFEKIGEVVEEMRRLGRGKYAAEMGIGTGN